MYVYTRMCNIFPGSAILSLSIVDTTYLSVMKINRKRIIKDKLDNINEKLRKYW